MFTFFDRKDMRGLFRFSRSQMKTDVTTPAKISPFVSVDINKGKFLEISLSPEVIKQIENANVSHPRSDTLLDRLKPAETYELFLIPSKSPKMKYLKPSNFETAMGVVGAFLGVGMMVGFGGFLMLFALMSRF